MSRRRKSRPPGSPERGDGPRITLATEAIVVADPVLNRLQLALRNGSTYEAGKDTGDYRITAFPAGDQALDARKPAEVRATRPIGGNGYAAALPHGVSRPRARSHRETRRAHRTASAAGAAAGLRADGAGRHAAGHHAEARRENPPPW